MQKIQDPHDRYFHAAMSNPKVAQELFSQFLPKTIQQYVDLSTLQLQNKTFIDKDLSKLISDILYKVSISDQDGYIYLLVEHQRKSDVLLPFRILEYTCRIIRRHLDKSDEKRLPIVLPMVIYNGDQPYQYSCNLLDLIEGPEPLLSSKLFTGSRLNFST